MRRRWTRFLTGARQDLSLQIVRNHLVPCPDLEKQQEIAAGLRPHNERVRELKREIAVLQRILKA